MSGELCVKRWKTPVPLAADGLLYSCGCNTAAIVKGLLVPGKCPFFAGVLCDLHE